MKTGCPGLGSPQWTFEKNRGCQVTLGETEHKQCGYYFIAHVVAGGKRLQSENLCAPFSGGGGGREALSTAREREKYIYSYSL